MSDENYFLVTVVSPGINACGRNKARCSACGSGRGDTQQILVAVCNSLLGTKFKSIWVIVPGRDESCGRAPRSRRSIDDQSLGVICHTSDGAAAFNPLLQAGLEKSPEFPDVPLRSSHAIPIRRSSSNFCLAQSVPAGLLRQMSGCRRIAFALRQAFDLAVKDPKLLEDAKRQNTDISPDRRPIAAGRRGNSRCRGRYCSNPAGNQAGRLTKARKRGFREAPGCIATFDFALNPRVLCSWN